MPEYRFLKQQRDTRSLQAEHADLQRRVVELTQTVQSLIEEIRDLNKEKIVWQKRSRVFDQHNSAQRYFEQGKAEFNLP